MTLTDEEREQVEEELVQILAYERKLAETVPINAAAAERKRDTLAKVHSSIRRLSAMLDEAPYPDAPLASRKAPA